MNKEQIKKHKDIILAWVDGATIQYYSSIAGNWVDCVNFDPLWEVNSQYRIKPIKRKRTAFQIYMDAARPENAPHEHTNFVAVIKGLKAVVEATKAGEIE